MYGGAGVLGLGILGSIIFASISLVEQVQAQDLLDNSPAFTKRDDKYLIRDSEHPDVGTYNALKSTANVLAQAGWISLGVGLSGGVAAGTAFLLNLEASE